MLLENLKQHTRLHHEQLERLNPLPDSVGVYVAQLESFYGFIRPWEEDLAERVAPDHVVRHRRAKTVWLAQDLMHFGYSAEQLEALPRCVDLPSAENDNALLGAAYVLEGSTLGGQFISRHIEQALGLQDGEGYRYFRSYGADVPARWQEFRQALLRQSSPQNDPQMLDAAQQTFAKLGAWFATRRALAA